MNTAFVIKKAILSEKAYTQMTKSIYSFKVDKRATKGEIASAVKKQFSVEVEKVNIITQSPTKRRITGTRKTVEILGGKKAIVYLKGGQTISLLSPKSEKPKPEKKTKNKEAQKSKEEIREKDKGKGLIAKITGSTEKEAKEGEKK